MPIAGVPCTTNEFLQCLVNDLKQAEECTRQLNAVKHTMKVFNLLFDGLSVPDIFIQKKYVVELTCPV